MGVDTLTSIRGRAYNDTNPRVKTTRLVKTVPAEAGIHNMEWMSALFGIEINRAEEITQPDLLSVSTDKISNSRGFQPADWDARRHGKIYRIL